MNNVWAEEIRSKVKMRDILIRYGFNPKRNRIPCPLHGGKNLNFGFDEDTFHCFTCGASGDIFSFVEKYFEISFYDAIQKINCDFGLGLPIGKQISLREQREMERKQREREAERKRREDEYNRKFDVYLDDVSEWQRLQLQYEKYRPKTMDEEINPKFHEALQKLSYAKYCVQYDETELMKIDHR